jgi:hypothetical protein
MHVLLYILAESVRARLIEKPCEGYEKVFTKPSQGYEAAGRICKSTERFFINIIFFIDIETDFRYRCSQTHARFVVFFGGECVNEIDRKTLRRL